MSGTTLVKIILYNEPKYVRHDYDNLNLHAEAKLESVRSYLAAHPTTTTARQMLESAHVLMFSQLGDNETWETTWQSLLEPHGHALFLDTGAARNLCGAYTPKTYELDCLVPYD